MPPLGVVFELPLLFVVAGGVGFVCCAFFLDGLVAGSLVVVVRGRVVCCVLMVLLLIDMRVIMLGQRWDSTSCLGLLMRMGVCGIE